MNGVGDEESPEANAQLISAAPDLLAVCKRFEELVEGGYNMWLQDDAGKDTCDLTAEFVLALVATRDAIAKAEGRCNA